MKQISNIPKKYLNIVDECYNELYANAITPEVGVLFPITLLIRKGVPDKYLDQCLDILCDKAKQAGIPGY